MDKFIESVSKIFEETFEKLGYDGIFGQVVFSNRPDLCQFQCNGALSAAKAFKKAPRVIAEEVVNDVKGNDIIGKVEIAGPGFINIDVKDEFIVDYVNEMSKNDKNGLKPAENPKTIIIDYGGPNVAKPLHVGHLRSAVIGESLKRLGRALGNKVIGDVHLGDWGIQIGLVISGLEKKYPEMPYFNEAYEGEYPNNPAFNIRELEEIYPQESKLAKESEDAMNRAKNITAELQNGRKGYVALWKQILNVSIEDLKKNYHDLNVEFDLWNGESDSEKFIPAMVEYLKNNGYARISEGALVVDVEEPDDKKPMPPIIIQKSDGASLYGTTDLATIWERMEVFSPDEIIYVVDKRQELHFEQVFRCAKKTGIAGENVKLQFIGFGTMNGKDGKPFKTRDGGVMKLSDLIALVNDRVKIKLRDSEEISFEEKEETAKTISVSALKYGDLSNIITKDYVFDLDKFTSFEGNTGLYILYTVARIKSILRKTDFKYSENLIVKPAGETERNLMLSICKFSETVEMCFEQKAPHKLCEYVYEVANTFNKFYHENKIITQEDQVRKQSWLNLIYLAVKILDDVLELLGINTLERM